MTRATVPALTSGLRTYAMRPSRIQEVDGLLLSQPRQRASLQLMVEAAPSRRRPWPLTPTAPIRRGAREEPSPKTASGGHSWCTAVYWLRLLRRGNPVGLRA
ncbi:hypothetical protein QAD02_022114 [Eretmocerus hayati]|uniref:Uncharacterized protein n=1 Tax=Eretmocerus hayati TaxID=131215 RepID=A0ACC2PRT0_9HYME|nr:hypothetical protein QAD02_022114 [Eretmocerus hayati]